MPGRTPCSLKWLIDKQTRLAGQIQRKKEMLERARIVVTHHRTDIARLNHDLAAIETAMGLHELQINPTDLASIRPHYTPRLLRYGQMSRIIRRTLAKAPERTASTSDILRAVLVALPRPLIGNQLKLLKKRLRIRLAIMALEGQILQLENARTCEPRVWQLPSHDRDRP